MSTCVSGAGCKCEREESRVQAVEVLEAVPGADLRQSRRTVCTSAVFILRSHLLSWGSSTVKAFCAVEHMRALGLLKGRYVAACGAQVFGKTDCSSSH